MLGGAFNPPHIGHLVLAQEAAAQLGLEEVLLVPVGEAPHRRIESDPGAEVRLELVTLAVEGDELLRASDIEVSRPGPSYTVHTLESLHEERPGDDPWFLIGADAAAGIGEWREPRRVLELARLGVAARGGVALDQAEAALKQLATSDRWTSIRMPELAVSSTDLRRRVAEGRPLRYLVPDAVRELISERGLYADG